MNRNSVCLLRKRRKIFFQKNKYFKKKIYHFPIRFQLNKFSQQPNELTKKKQKRYQRAPVGHYTSSFLGRTLTPKDSKTWRRRGLEWDVVIREADKTPDRTTPLAMLSAIFPAPINPSLYASAWMGKTSMILLVKRRRKSLNQKATRALL